VLIFIAQYAIRKERCCHLPTFASLIRVPLYTEHTPITVRNTKHKHSECARISWIRSCASDERLNTSNLLVACFPPFPAVRIAPPPQLFQWMKDALCSAYNILARCLQTRECIATLVKRTGRINVICEIWGISAAEDRMTIFNAVVSAVIMDNGHTYVKFKSLN
jgi:hypothetical protein